MTGKTNPNIVDVTEREDDGKDIPGRSVLFRDLGLSTYILCDHRPPPNPQVQVPFTARWARAAVRVFPTFKNAQT